MIGYKFRLRFRSLSETLLQDLGSFAVILAAFLLKQRLVGGVANQGVPKAIVVARGRWELIKEFRVDQAIQSTCQLCLFELRNRPKQVVGTFLADDGRNLSDFLRHAEAIQTCHKRFG